VYAWVFIWLTKRNSDNEATEKRYNEPNFQTALITHIAINTMQFTLFSIGIAALVALGGWQLLFGLSKWPTSQLFVASLLTLLLLLPVGTSLAAKALQLAKQTGQKPIISLLLFIISSVALFGLTLWLGVQTFVQMT
jgi:hypothetical protein